MKWWKYCVALHAKQVKEISLCMSNIHSSLHEVPYLYPLVYKQRIKSYRGLEELPLRNYYIWMFTSRTCTFALVNSFYYFCYSWKVKMLVHQLQGVECQGMRVTWCAQGVTWHVYIYTYTYIHTFIIICISYPITNRIYLLPHLGVFPSVVLTHIILSQQNILLRMYACMYVCMYAVCMCVCM